MSDNTLKAQRKRAAKPMLWIGIASMAMVFAGLTSGYVVSRSALQAKEGWLSFDIPLPFFISTALIVLSSFVMIYAVRSAREGNSAGMQTGLWVTLVLGVTFTFLQFYGWQELIDSNIYFTGEGSNPAGSWFYVITAFHLVHIAAGLIVLIVTLVKAYMGKYTSEDYQGVEMAAIFWHFVDILWIYLFLFLAIIR